MSASKNPFEKNNATNPFSESPITERLSRDSPTSLSSVETVEPRNGASTDRRSANERQTSYPEPSTSRPESRVSVSSVPISSSRYRTSGTDVEIYSDRPKRVYDFYDACVNLPAVLNDPRKPRPAEFLTRTWGDAFVEHPVRPSPLLEEVNLESFRPYMRCINVREALLKGTKSSSDGSGRSSAKGHKHSCPDDLQEIPALFFNHSFNLENLGMLRQICPAEQTQKSLRIVQDRLGHYLDTVESEIARHVSIRAEAFFGVVSNHDLLQEKMEASLSKVVSLRNWLRTVRDVSVKPAVMTVAKVQRRQNLNRIMDKLQTIATISQTQLTIQMLLSNGDFVGALDLITTTREVVASDLSGLTCFRHLSHQLQEMEKFIDKMMSLEFRRALSAHLNRAPDQNSHKMLEEDRFAAIVTGLLRQRRFNVVDWFRDEALSSLRATLKLVLIQTLTDLQDGDVVAIEDDGHLPYYLLKNLDFDGLVLLFKELRKPLAEILLRIRAAHDVTIGLHGSFGQESRAGSRMDGREGDSGGLTTNDFSRLYTQLQELLFAVGEETQEEIARILNRSPGWKEFKNVDLVPLWDVLELIMKDGESVLGIRMTVLNAQLQKLAFAFVARFHDDRKQKLTLILDSERWSSVEIPVEFQSFIDSVFTDGTFLVPLPRQRSDESMNGQSGDHSPVVSSPKAVVSCLTVEYEQYLVVGTVVLLLRMLGEYMALTVKLPSSMNISGDILQKVVELLKMFNTRTCQLVLGAGAMQSAGLRSITSKNLILSSRCLQLVTLFIPVVADDLVKQLPSKQQHLSKNFDSLARDYDAHIEEIEKKLVSIFDTQLITHFSRWEAVVPVPSQSFRMIFTAVKRLHDAVCNMLPETHLERLFRSLFIIFKRRLKQQIVKLNIVNDGGPQHGVVTAELAFFSTEIQSLQSLTGLEENFSDVWDR